MATKRRRAALPAGVTRLRDRIEHWRRTRAKRTAMPATLWSEAVTLARRGGAYAIARALRIDFDSLTRRIAEAARDAARTPASPPSAFVELTGAQLLAASPSTGTIVELSDDKAGIRVTVRLAAEAPLDVARLVSAFRHRGDA